MSRGPRTMGGFVSIIQKPIRSTKPSFQCSCMGSPYLGTPLPGIDAGLPKQAKCRRQREPDNVAHRSLHALDEQPADSLQRIGAGLFKGVARGVYPLVLR